MNRLNQARTLAVSLGVLAGAMLAASPAMAFNDVNWEWETEVNTNVNIDAYIKLKVDITGMVQVEKLQIFLGNVEAESTVYDITNTPFYPVVEQKRHEHDGYGGYGDGDKAQTYAIDEGRYGHHDFDKINVAPLDARTELPIVLSSATAIGNNQSITSDVPVFLHDGQFVANVNSEDNYWGSPQGTYAAWGEDPSNGNSNTTLAVLFTLGSAFGLLKPAEISAESTVYDIKNASVDSSATAVANNISVTLATDDPKNRVLIADITQFALANVSAESTVYDVSATGYDHMRQLKTDTLQTVNGQANVPVSVPTPWVSSVATAIGNNTSITVGPVLK